MQTQGCNTEPLDNTRLYDSSKADDSSLFSTPSAHNSSFGLIEYRTDDSIAEQLQTTFVDMNYFMTGSSTAEFPINIYYDSNSSCLYKSPRLLHDDLMPFFLSYHRENINYGHYFWYYDHHRFIKKDLLDLAKQSNSLQYAIAAFSALIYSNQVDYHMKKLTFIFYSKAIQDLQQVINTDSIDSEASIYTTIATILELASIEVYPCPKSLMIAGYCRYGQVFSTCERRCSNLSKTY